MEIFDPIFGRIAIPTLFEKIINSFWFRRLQELRQLGLCYLSFPGGNHSRFEHSIGTFYLSTIISQNILSSNIISDQRQKERLCFLLGISTLCHDIGHGPFSHMTENVLVGLGANLSHEEIGAGIITHMLTEELRDFQDWDISPEIIGGIITKEENDDPFAICAIELVSSDVDLDRIEYLHRDLHYSGVDSIKFSPETDLLQNWNLNRYGEQIYFELTNKGIDFAEKILFLRRNNYQRIVYDSRHMAATSMFEKSMDYAFNSQSWLGEKIRDLINSRLNWRDENSFRSNFDSIWELYGLVDFQAINLIRDSCREARYLTDRIRRGRLYDTLHNYSWSELHYLTKQKLLKITDKNKAYVFRRDVEKFLADNTGIEPFHITANIPLCSVPKPLLSGVGGGNILEERSALGHFFINDHLQQYKIEVFLDKDVDSTTKDRILDLCNKIFKDGNLNF